MGTYVFIAEIAGIICFMVYINLYPPKRKQESNEVRKPADGFETIDVADPELRQLHKDYLEAIKRSDMDRMILLLKSYFRRIRNGGTTFEEEMAANQELSTRKPL